MILKIATILLIIASIIYTIAVAKFVKKNKQLNEKLLVLESKNIRENQIINGLKKATLQTVMLNGKLDGELQFWKHQRKLIDKVPTSFRKKKIRGKRRKERK